MVKSSLMGPGGGDEGKEATPYISHQPYHDRDSRTSNHMPDPMAGD